MNGGGSRIDGISAALAESGTDICVLSEYTKASSERLIHSLAARGFVHQLHTEPAEFWGGVLVASRGPIERGDVDNCPSPDRWLHVVVKNAAIEIGAAYIPNSERSRDEKSAYWNWLLEVGSKLLHRAALIGGDFNTGLPNVDENGATLVCANAMQQMLMSGWTDLWRRANPQVRESSWWSSSGNGFRLDHAFASPTVVPKFRAAEYLTKVNDRCVVHPRRIGDDCGAKPLSDHSMLRIDLALEKS
jgi:exonuclease III